MVHPDVVLVVSRKKYSSASHARNTTESPLNFIYSKRRENINKTQREEKKVRKLILQGEGIIIPHIRCTQQQPFLSFFVHMGVIIYRLVAIGFN